MNITVAGMDFMSSSPIFKCINNAAVIKKEIMEAENNNNLSQKSPKIKPTAERTFMVPTIYTKDSFRPYALNSSIILIASPPLYIDGLLNLNNQTFIMVIETVRMDDNLINFISQKVFLFNSGSFFLSFS